MKISPINIITHFYNEEYLLPWWCKHHKNLFDDAILIDYHSTDKSREIIKNTCPYWKIHESKNLLFDAIENDKEVMEYEKSLKTSISHFKICLNTTEFLLMSEKFIDRLKKTKEKSALEIRKFAVCDNEPEIFPTPSISLIQQKHYVTKDIDSYCINLFRYMHNFNHGDYGPGRHATNIRNIIKVSEDEAIIMWYWLSPWTPEFIRRKTQIKKMIPESDIAKGHGFQHLWDENKMNQTRIECLEHCFDLSALSIFNNYIC